MEEILASIRRIIADDDATKSVQQAPEPPKPVAPAARPAVPPPRMPAPPPRVTPPPVSPVEAPPAAKAAAVDEQSADILELTESMAAPMPAPAAPPAPALAAAFRTIDGGSDIGFDEAPEKAAPQPSAEAPSRLLSRSTTAAVDSAFNSLAQTVLVQNAKTLEDLVREMLRPMLKVWLDENLPAMVERLVRAEIERVSRGR